jgi:hypothetical protein
MTLQPPLYCPRRLRSHRSQLLRGMLAFAIIYLGGAYITHAHSNNEPSRLSEAAGYTSRQYSLRLDASSTAADTNIGAVLESLMRQRILKIVPATLSDSSGTLPRAAVHLAMANTDFVPEDSLLLEFCRLNEHVCTVQNSRRAIWRSFTPRNAQVEVTSPALCDSSFAGKPLEVICVPDVLLVSFRSSTRIDVTSADDFESKLRNLGGCPRIDANCAYTIALLNPGVAHLQREAERGSRALVSAVRSVKGSIRVPAIRKTLFMATTDDIPRALAVAQEAVISTVRRRGVPPNITANVGNAELLASILHLRVTEAGSVTGVDRLLQSRAGLPTGTLPSGMRNAAVAAAAEWRRIMAFDAIPDNAYPPNPPPPRIGIIDTLPDFSHAAFVRPAGPGIPYCARRRNSNSAKEASGTGIIRIRPGSVFAFESLCPGTVVSSCPGDDPLPSDHSCFPLQDDGQIATFLALR